ncbi:MAG: hypothetical protein HRU20_22485 [Pseudomonadales bacterium]|nr:hypothetical protein [Pseudomonadales bacterium]
MLGLSAYIACIVIAYSSTALTAFWTALILLGVGWNFLFVAGTSLLPSCYKEGEQFKVQAFNDACVFSLQAVAALSAGFVLQQSSWPVLLLCCLPLMALLAFLLWNTRVREPTQVLLK